MAIGSDFINCEIEIGVALNWKSVLHPLKSVLPVEIDLHSLKSVLLPVEIGVSSCEFASISNRLKDAVKDATTLLDYHHSIGGLVLIKIMDCSSPNVVEKKKYKPKHVWNTENTTYFIDMCLNEKLKGNKPGSHLNKAGWLNLEKAMLEKTGKVFDKKQLSNKWDGMKKDWKLYDRLMRLETGIGGTRSLIDASEEWWAEKINVNKEFAKFKDTNLDIFATHYAPLFQDSVAVGDHTMTPLQFHEENTEGQGDSDEINLADDDALFPPFPDDSSNKRKKTSGQKRSTKSKTSYEEKLDVVLEALSTKSTQTFPQNTSFPTLEDCMSIVSSWPGFEEGSEQYAKALFVFSKKSIRESFMYPTTDTAKLMVLKMDSDASNSSDDEEQYRTEDDINFLKLCGLAVRGIVIGRNLRKTRNLIHTSDATGHKLVTNILNGNGKRCYQMFRLHVPVYRQLCKDLVTKYGLTQTRNIAIEESLAIFLVCLAHGCTNRFMQEIFNHSGETISRHFHKVLKAVLKMSADIIKPNDNYNHNVPDYILNNPRYYPYFKDCIGTIDGTHVKASVAQHEQAKYIGRKGHATQNIMAVCDFNMCFTFVWAGWEGTAHDTRIFNEALERSELHFPRPMGEKYYVVDAGYPNTRGYLAPYKGATIRYHLPDFQRANTPALRAPSGAKETFNFRHSSLRNIIERTFGVWKARWAILRDMHVNFTYDHQVKIVLASMAMHNYIRKAGIIDEAFNTAQQESYDPTPCPNTPCPNTNGAQEGPTRRPMGNEDSLWMAAYRDMIAEEIMNI
ncbi:hypothetical protein LXL04_038652 [Taraxacum kok-saghyz]